MPTAPLPLLPLLAALLIVTGAGVVRGFAGFGFSALCVAGLSLIVSPAEVIPPIFMLEVLASLSLLRSAWRDIDWSWMSWLVLGNALCIPLGIAMLAWLPEQPLRVGIGALLAVAALMLRSGTKLALAPTRGARLLTGLVSGWVNGLAAIGGIAVAVLLSTSAMPAAALRATLIGMFLFTDIWALGSAALITWGTSAPTELVGPDTLRWALWLTPAMLLGIAIGQRMFSGVSPEAFRRRVLDLLTLVAVLVVARAAWG